MPKPLLEFALPLLGTAIRHARAELGVPVPSERPVLEHVVVTERTHHSLADHLVAGQTSRVRDDAIAGLNLRIRSTTWHRWKWREGLRHGAISLI